MTETPDQRTRRLLQEHGFPPGLLPPGITDGTIGGDGRFSVTLPRRTERVHGGYPVRFGSTIEGSIATGEIRELKGVSVRQVVWLPVGAISADGDALVFSVGPVRRPLPVTEFPWPES